MTRSRMLNLYNWILRPFPFFGRRNVIAAGAVVTKSTPDGVLMAGVPAVIKKKYSTEEIQ